MFKELNKKETEALLMSASAFTSESPLEMGIGLYPRYYRIDKSFQFTFEETDGDLTGQLAECPVPPPPSGCRVTALIEMTCGLSIMQLDAIRGRITELLGEGMLTRFVPAYYYAGDFPARLTLVCHAASPRRLYLSALHRESEFLMETEHRIARKLDAELQRNREEGVVSPISASSVADMMYRHHLLWTGIANSNASVSEIADKLRPEMERMTEAYDVSGLFLFIETDRSFTRQGEVDELVRQLVGVAGGTRTDVAVNLRTRESFIKYVTCRAALVGNPRFAIGEVYEDYGQLEILLYSSGDTDRGHEIVASLDGGLFVLSRFDWGVEGKLDGKTDDYYYFDKENTGKLFEALHVKNPRALLKTVRRRFAGSFPSMADQALLRFCRERGIHFEPDYYY